MNLYDNKNKDSEWIVFTTNNPEVVEQYRYFFNWDWLYQESYGIYYFRDEVHEEYSYYEGKIVKVSTWYSRKEAEEEINRWFSWADAKVMDSLREIPGIWKGRKREGMFSKLEGAPLCVRRAFLYGIQGKSIKNITQYFKLRGGEEEKKFREVFLKGTEIKGMDGSYWCYGCNNKSNCLEKWGILNTFGFGIDLGQTRQLLSGRNKVYFNISLRTYDNNTYQQYKISSQELTSMQSFKREVMEQGVRQGIKINPFFNNTKEKQTRFNQLIELIINQGEAVKARLKENPVVLKFVRSVLLISQDPSLINGFKTVSSTYGINLEIAPFFTLSYDEGDYDLFITDNEEKVEGLRFKEKKVVYYKTERLHEHYLTSLSKENIIKALSTIKEPNNAILAQRIRELGGRGAYQVKDGYFDFNRGAYRVNGKTVYLTPSQEIDILEALHGKMKVNEMSSQKRENISRAGLLSLFEEK